MYRVLLALCLRRAANTQHCETMSKNKNTTKGWDIARAKAKSNYARKMKLSKYWANRWKTQPDMMRANLNRLVKANRDKADHRTKRLNDFVSHLPPRIKSWDLRPSIAKLYLQLSGQELPKLKIHSTVMNLRRRGMITYDESSCEWIIKPVA